MTESVDGPAGDHIYLLVHYEGNEAVTEPKVIGAFLSAAEARSCIHDIMENGTSSYCRIPEGFAIQQFKLGKPFTMQEL